MDLLCYEEIKYNYLEETNECNICYEYFWKFYHNEDYHNGVYKVDDNLYPRKEIQLVKGNVIKLPEKSKQEQAIINERIK